jgi:hypothetical protein
MGWTVDVRRPVCQAINSLRASGALSRRGLVWAYAAVRIVLPRKSRFYQPDRAAHAPDCFVYWVGFWDRGVWHRFTFIVNDSLQPGVLVVEEMRHKARP